MSRTGNKAIDCSNIEISLEERKVTVKGPKGELSIDLHETISADKIEESLRLSRANDSKTAKERHGLTRSLIANAIEGVKNGYSQKMFLQGIGYRVQKKGNDLEFSLGYSHPVKFKSPDGIQFKVEGQHNLEISGISKELVGQVAANIKRLRKKDAYKGKGVFYEGEVIRKKPGKSIKK